MKTLIPLHILLLVGLLGSVAVADDEKHLYSTGRIMEVDRCASAWLIKRHIDPRARFAFFEDGQLITLGTAFDTPDARYSRTHNLSTFEVLMRRFKIKGPKLDTLAAAINEIEINYWAGRRDHPLAAEISVRFREIARSHPQPEACLAACFDYFDKLIRELPAKDAGKDNKK